MKNRRIPGFPLPEDQGTLQFYFFKNLSYTTRIILYIGCIAAGFVFQFLTISLWPGAFLIIFAAILNLVKGYSCLPAPVSKRQDDNWARTGMDKVYQIKRMKANINKWDKDAMDISNGVGCLLFGVAAIVLLLVSAILQVLIGKTASNIFIIDSVILILSLWFNGMRKKGHQNNLYIKTDLIIELERHFTKIKHEGENLVPSLNLQKDKEGKDFPKDCRFNIIFDNAPDDFYGILAQININTVDAIYPYFYCVITAKNGYGLKNYIKQVDVPKGIVVEHSEDSEADVIVIRQKTTKSSGYHTKINACKNILELAIALARIILEG